jgi:hypothetical protein
VGYSPIVPEHYTLADCDFVLDIQAAKQALGWAPKLDNVEMLCEAYDWYVALPADLRPTQHPVVKLLNACMPSSRGR